MKRLMIIGLWPDDTVNYCTEKCDCRRYAFDRILYHKGGRAARERICIPVVDRSGAVTTYLDLPVTLLEAGVVYLRLDDGSDIFLSDTQMVLIANEVERRRAELAGTGLKTLGKWFESGLPTYLTFKRHGDTWRYAGRCFEGYAEPVQKYQSSLERMMLTRCKLLGVVAQEVEA